MNAADRTHSAYLNWKLWTIRLVCGLRFTGRTLTNALESERKGEVLLLRHTHTPLRVALQTAATPSGALLQPEAPLPSESPALCCLFLGISAPTPSGKETMGLRAGEPACMGQSWPLRTTVGTMMMAM